MPLDDICLQIKLLGLGACATFLANAVQPPAPPRLALAPSPMARAAGNKAWDANVCVYVCFFDLANCSFLCFFLFCFASSCLSRVNVPAPLKATGVSQISIKIIAPFGLSATICEHRFSCSWHLVKQCGRPPSGQAHT